MPKRRGGLHRDGLRRFLARSIRHLSRRARDIGGRALLALDGVYVREDSSDPRSPLVFRALPTPTRAEVAEVAHRTAQRVEKLLQARGRSLDPERNDAEPVQLQLEHPALAACYDAAALGIAISGDRAGHAHAQALLIGPDRACTRGVSG